MCTTCHPAFAPFITDAEIISLEGSVRHARDPGHRAFLNRIRKHAPTAAQLSDWVRGSHTIADVPTDTAGDEQAGPEQPVNVLEYGQLLQACCERDSEGRLPTVITSHKDDARELSQLITRRLFGDGDTLLVPVVADLSPEPPAAVRERMRAWAADPKFNELSTVCVGARVQLTRTVNRLKVRLPNSSPTLAPHRALAHREASTGRPAA